MRHILSYFPGTDWPQIDIFCQGRRLKQAGSKFNPLAAVQIKLFIVLQTRFSTAKKYFSCKSDIRRSFWFALYSLHPVPHASFVRVPLIYKRSVNPTLSKQKKGSNLPWIWSYLKSMFFLKRQEQRHILPSIYFNEVKVRLVLMNWLRLQTTREVSLIRSL